MTRYEIALKRSEHFDLIADYCLQMIEAFCRQYNLDIIYSGEVGINKMGRTGVFSLIRSREKATRYLEVSFFYDEGENGDILWKPYSPLIRVY